MAATEKLLGISLFDWEDWDQGEDNDLMFHDVKWHFDSMKQYDGMCVTMCRNGSFSIENDDGETVIGNRLFTEIEEFREELEFRL